MKPKLVNNCKKNYKPNPIRITERILSKIPNKFLVDLGEIHFHDHSNNPIIKYSLGTKNTRASKIDIFMGGFSKNCKYSLLHFNLAFLPTITEHIVKYLQPISNDPEIQAAVLSRYNPKWLYLRSYAIVIAPIIYMSFMYKKISIIRIWFDRFINWFLDKHFRST